MEIIFKRPNFRALNCLIPLIFFGLFFEVSLFSESKAQEIEAIFAPAEISQLTIFQNNTLISVSNPVNPKPVKRLLVIATAYSSTPEQTDDTPHITAAGTLVRDGIIANNWLPFGTEVRIPELFGDKIFVVEDRMSWKKGNYQIDIWFSEYWQALSFGAKLTELEIVQEN